MIPPPALLPAYTFDEPPVVDNKMVLAVVVVILNQRKVFPTPVNVCVPAAVPLVDNVIELASAGGVTVPIYVKSPPSNMVLNGEPLAPSKVVPSNVRLPVTVVVFPGKVFVPLPDSFKFLYTELVDNVTPTLLYSKVLFVAKVPNVGAVVFSMVNSAALLISIVPVKVKPDGMVKSVALVPSPTITFDAVPETVQFAPMVAVARFLIS